MYISERYILVANYVYRPDVSGKYSTMQKLLHEECSLTFPQLSIWPNHSYSCVNWGFVTRTKMPKLRNSSTAQVIRTEALSIENAAHYTASQMCLQFFKAHALNIVELNEQYACLDRQTVSDLITTA